MVLQMIHDILSDNESNSIVQTNYIKFVLFIIIILGDSFDAFAFHPEPLALLPLGTDWAADNPDRPHSFQQESGNYNYPPWGFTKNSGVGFRQEFHFSLNVVSLSGWDDFV